MSVLTASRLVGLQTPRLESWPEIASSAGDDAIDLAASVGLHLDEWQQYVLRNSLGERVDGKWATPDVALVVSRQNGKNAVLEARELAGLFLFDEQLLIHTAHEMKASAVTFRRIVGLIQGSPKLKRRVKNIAFSKGDEGVELHSGARLRFMARTGGSGRSFSADFLALDEAYNLPDHVMNALLPTQAAMPNPQTWYTSSAVNQIEHPHGLTLARVRRRGMSGDDHRLAYFEWSGDEDAYKADPRGYALDRDVWAQANPGLGIRISEEFLADQVRRLGPAGFAAEHLSIGNWPAEPADELPKLIEAEMWDGLGDRLSTVSDPVAFAVHAGENGSSAAVCAVGRRPDGLLHLEVLAHHKSVLWVVDYLVERVVRHHPCAVVVDPAGPAGQLIQPLQNAGVEVDPITAREFQQACQAFYVAAVERTDEQPTGGFRHMNDPRLNDAVLGAGTRKFSQGWVVDAKASSADVSPLIAVILGMHGFVKHEDEGGVNLW